ncbi:MAG: hypothetical protein LBG99_05165 [Propionibacteriaceae bacterium]|nr:hypothetical protein [Propionibacteriaceae bacterium]
MGSIVRPWVMYPRLVRDSSRPDTWIVHVDGTDQSLVDLNDPTYVLFFLEESVLVDDSSI